MHNRIVTVGNPNSGKTTLFNQLTGARQQVGNWAGVTVEKKTGQYTFNNNKVSITDLPGIYSLDNSDDINSPDESIAVKALFSSDVDLIINVVDASSLERSLYLTMQLRELGDPMVVVLNKMDVLERQGFSIDTDKLAAALQCQVLTVSATKNKQVQSLKAELENVLSSPLRPAPKKMDYGQSIETAISELESILVSVNEDHRRASAIRLMTEDQLMIKSLPTDTAMKVSKVIKKHCADDDNDLMIANTRYTAIANICQDCRKKTVTTRQRMTDAIDSIALHKFFGIPFFFAVMYLMFLFSINIGSAFIDFFDIGVGAILVDGGHALMDGHLPVWLTTLLADGIGGGIQTVSTFIPVIGCLYLFMSLLESSGYMARAAFVLDRAMQKIGLPGKAFVPLVLGFGCNVPAIMATRTLDQERERKLAAAMAPFMSCGARLPVYALFAAAFFPESAQNIVFLLYLAGIAVAILTGVILRKTLYPGESESMLMEIPEYEIPTMRNILIKTWNKLKRFVLGAGKTIVVVVTLLTMANSVALDGTFGHTNTDESVLSKAAQIVTPIFSPIGIEEDNWQATVGIITGIFAKEAVVGTLSSLYNQSNDDEDGEFNLKDKLLEAVNSIPNNLVGLNFADPLGIAVDTDKTALAEEQDVDVSIFTSLQQKFTASGAFAYLVFILLYTPCVAAMGAYVREFGKPFSAFIASWTMLQAVVFAIVTYQLLNIVDHPVHAAMWIAISMAMLAASVMALKQAKARQDNRLVGYDSI